MPDNAVSAPDGLGDRGSRFWRQVTSEFVLRADEQQLLTEACRMLDLVDRLADVVDDDGATTSGSRGQLTVHPCLSELRQVRQELRHHLRELGLPDVEDVEAGGTLRAV